MPHAVRARRKTNRPATPGNNASPNPNSHYVSDAVRSWVKNVIAPALVRAYLADQNLQNGGVRA